MLDYYSSMPPPSVIGEKMCIKRIYRKKRNNINTYISEDEENNILNKIFEPHLNPDGIIKYSYTGWFAGEARREVEYYYTHEMNRVIKIKIRRKIKALFMSVYLSIKWYKEAKERMYHPDSDFVKNILREDFYNRI